MIDLFDMLPIFPRAYERIRLVNIIPEVVDDAGSGHRHILYQQVLRCTIIS